MTVNPIKSKCITFSTKNKRNKKDIFHIGTAPLENISECKYLGLKVNAAGSFLLSKNFLSDKANRAKFAFNNIAELKHLPVKTAIRLFDAAVLPILTYGDEVWALNLTLNNDKWTKQQLKEFTQTLSNIFLELIDQQIITYVEWN